MSLNFKHVLGPAIPTRAFAFPCYRYLSTKFPPNPLDPSNPSSTPTPDQRLSPLAQRLSDATDEALATGGPSTARLLTSPATFNSDFRTRLLAKLAAADLSSTVSTASATVSMPPAAGEGTRDIALSEPWKGEEKTEDAVLRMLDDGVRKLPVDLRRPVNFTVRRVDPRARAARAREMAERYVDKGMKNKGEKDMDETEREERSKMFKERFEPGTRALPNSLGGLANLANERIEEAMGRGAFKGIKRGVGIGRDNRADNPFIDTTEYIMNNIIKAQNLVPPWINKQQEITQIAGTFRDRLRRSWKARLLDIISQKAPDFNGHLRIARQNAQAEAKSNPPSRNSRNTGTVGASITDDPVMKAGTVVTKIKEFPASSGPEEEEALSQPIRDRQWEEKERQFVEVSIKELNAHMRSYNLMAPDLAKKAYFSLEREMRRCFGDVAAEMEKAVREEADRKTERAVGLGSGGLFGLGSLGSSGLLVRELPSHSGVSLRDMWRDIWGKK